MTAVTWLLGNLISEPYTEADFKYNAECWDKAEEMEQQQIIDTYVSGYTNGVESMIDENLSVPSPEEYYNETFKTE